MALQVTIDNPDLEKELLDLLKDKKQNLEEITVDALKNFVNSFGQKEKFHYTKRDPKKFSRAIVFEDDEDVSDVKPYAHVEDSGKYIHDLRRKRNF
ncbi:MAG: hypothetical protein JXQ76_03260 [Campylobacterales bacterium]|nr:hypothetical protein [Campylobacterales bacterium]